MKTKDGSVIGSMLGLTVLFCKEKSALPNQPCVQGRGDSEISRPLLDDFSLPRDAFGHSELYSYWERFIILLPSWIIFLHIFLYLELSDENFQVKAVCEVPWQDGVIPTSPRRKNPGEVGFAYIISLILIYALN
ncbi:uncharacterized protein LOC143644256 [Tamandua tetradactyla]|uniref:uncharacterized protein LOC143644256 n=1 Tax=Tamandua tetradactyla TaxID=48850 RepID=UPI004053E6F4